VEGPQALSFQLASEASFLPAAEHTFLKDNGYPTCQISCCNWCWQKVAAIWFWHASQKQYASN